MSEPQPGATVDRASPWPQGTTIQQIVYVTKQPTDRRIVCELPVALNRRAVALPVASSELPDLEILSIPSDVPDEPELLARVRDWVTTDPAEASQLMTFQGATLYWSVRRSAVIAPASRLAPLEGVLAEMSYYEQELREVERSLNESWPELEEDAGPAFDFHQRDMRKRARLEKRFRELLSVRARITCILPHLLTPHVFPPTLASQMSERFRERLRMRHRVEMVQEQLEVFERIYDTCAQRASDFRHAHKSHLLELAIIVLLVAQILLVLFETLTQVKN